MPLLDFLKLIFCMLSKFLMLRFVNLELSRWLVRLLNMRLVFLLFLEAAPTVLVLLCCRLG